MGQPGPVLHHYLCERSKPRGLTDEEFGGVSPWRVVNHPRCLDRARDAS